MFCEKCGAEMIDNVCPNCKDEVIDIQPVMSEDEAYRTASKTHWYCYFLPILFFVPILKEKKNIPGNIDVANNALWLFILNLATSFLSAFDLGFISSILSLLSLAVSVVGFALFIAALCGKAFRLPVVGDIKIIK